MSLVFRLAARNLSRPQFLRHQRTGLINFVRSSTQKCMVDSAGAKDESHDERNMRLGRPQSPHLTIYKPQLTALLSITHRATGIILSSYIIAFSMAAVFLECPIEYWIEELRCAEVGPACISALKFMLAMPLTYHFWNGVRHLFWDMGFFLSTREVYATGYVMLTLAIASAIMLSTCS